MKERKYSKNLSLYYFSNLDTLHGVSHFVSGRKGGVSTGEVGELNMSFSVKDDIRNVQSNRSIIAETLGVPLSNLVIPEQEHTANIAIVDQNNFQNIFKNTDALVTNTSGILIAVMSADCIPVLICDPVRKVVAAIHAGWRGTMSGIVSKTIAVMQKEFHSDSSKLIAGIGPGICQDKYEVGEEVIYATKKNYADTEGILKFDKHTNKAKLDLWEANRKQLLAAGIKEDSIEVAGICTYSNPDTFFSARRSANEGRFSAGIMIQ
jgi:YfiH family protein